MSLIDCEEMFVNLPPPKTPGAPNLSDTGSSSPFVFSSFGSLCIFEDDDDCDNQHSLLSGTSAYSPPLCTPASDELRVAYHPITPPGFRSNFGMSNTDLNAGSNGLGARGLGLGLIGVFKDDGTPFHISTISRPTDDEETGYSELPSFLEGLSPDVSFLYEESFIDDYQESATSTPAIDRAPSPCMLDDVFSQLAIKSSSPTSSRPRSYGSGNRVQKDGPEEPDCDDVFIERGRVMS
jgi:hypothetical protein